MPSKSKTVITLILLIILWIFAFTYLSKLTNHPKVIVGYWYTSENGAVLYPIPGSLSSDAKSVTNQDMKDKINFIDILVYAFFHVNKAGITHFNNSYIALSPISNSFCMAEKAICTDLNNKYTPKLGNFEAFAQLQNTNETLKKIISISGGGDKTSFTNAITHLPQFIDSVAKIVHHYNLDGVDLDFEPTSFTPLQAKLYGKLVKELRSKLGNRKIIMVTIGTNQNITGLNWRDISTHLNYVTTMCYEFHSPFSVPFYTTHNSNLYPLPNQPKSIGHTPASCDQSVSTLIALGVPAKKIILGYPSFGIIYGGVTKANNGLYQPYDFNKTPEYDKNIKLPGAVRYSTILELLKKGFQEYSERANGHLSAVWAYNPLINEFISYDSPAIVREKARYVARKNLAGLMTWTINDDAPITSESSLLKAANSLRQY